MLSVKGWSKMRATKPPGSNVTERMHVVLTRTGGLGEIWVRCAYQDKKGMRDRTDAHLRTLAHGRWRVAEARGRTETTAK